MDKLITRYHPKNYIQHSLLNLITVNHMNKFKLHDEYKQISNLFGTRIYVLFFK